MNITMRDGRVLSGTALQIVRQMQSLAFGAEDFSLAKYVQFVVDNTQRFESIALSVAGSTDDELARSLIDELERAEMIKVAA